MVFREDHLANLTWSSTLEDRVAYTLFGNSYSSLTTQQKAMLDGTSSSSPPTAGFARDGFHTVQQAAQWYELLGATTSSDAAESWMVYLIAYTMSMSARPERIAELKAAMESYEKQYRQSVTATEITTGFASSAFTLTCQSVRYYVLQASINRSAKLTIQPESIDSTLIWVMNYVWNKANWNFRRIRVKISVPSTSNGESPTITYPDGSALDATVKFDSLATRNLYYIDTTNTQYVQWATADQMSALKSISTAQSDRPLWLRIERSANTRKWIWHPYPDTTYNLSTEIFIMLPGTTTPGIPTSATDTVPFSLLPTELIPVVKELTYGKLLKDQGVTPDVWESANDELERFVPIYDDHGEMDSENGTRDVYGDAARMTSSLDGGRWFGYGGANDMGGAM